MPTTRVSPTPHFQSFQGHASPAVWAEVATLFASAFSAAPYHEDPAELAAITGWGPAQLAQPGGRLVAAHTDGGMAAFALSHGLAADPSWQEILPAAMGADSPHQGLLADPHTVVVIHELAVAAPHRGRGLARECVRRLLANRPESHAVLGVYGQAADAHAMYRKWGFDELGTAHLPGAAVALRVLGCRLPLPPAGNQRTADLQLIAGRWQPAARNTA